MNVINHMQRCIPGAYCGDLIHADLMKNITSCSLGILLILLLLSYSEVVLLVWDVTVEVCCVFIVDVTVVADDAEITASCVSFAHSSGKRL